MTILHHLGNVIRAFVTPVEARYTIDTIAYHAQPNEKVRRFSPTNALRRYRCNRTENALHEHDGAARRERQDR